MSCIRVQKGFAYTPNGVFAWLAAMALCLACACGLAACGGGGGGGGSTDKGTTSGPAYSMPAAISAISFNDSAAMHKGNAAIDTSNVQNGTVSASAQNANKLKFQVTDGQMSYNYDLPGDGTPITVPINMGSGQYAFRVMQNTSGNNYVEIASVSENVTLANELSPFLVPNMFVNYAEGDAVVAKARELASDAENQGDVVRNIFNWVVENVKYDFDKADRLSKATGYVPNPVDTLNTKSGICFDYSSLTASMLRSLGIPAQVVTGNVDPEGVYHAWNMVYIDGTWVTVSIDIPAKKWSRVDTTFAATSNAAGNSKDKTYSDRYIY